MFKKMKQEANKQGYNQAIDEVLDTIKKNSTDDIKVLQKRIKDLKED